MRKFEAIKFRWGKSSGGKLTSSAEILYYSGIGEFNEE